MICMDDPAADAQALISDVVRSTADRAGGRLWAGYRQQGQL
jgi:hypothetical protein